MQIESRRIETIIHSWILLEELKQRRQLLAEKVMSASHPTGETYRPMPEHCVEVRRTP